jgi:hypothetical protein
MWTIVSMKSLWDSWISLVHVVLGGICGLVKDWNLHMDERCAGMLLIGVIHKDWGKTLLDQGESHSIMHHLINNIYLLTNKSTISLLDEGEARATTTLVAIQEVM